MFKSLAYENTFDGISKRSTNENRENRGSKFRGIYPKTYRNDSNSVWQPLQGYPTPVYVKKPLLKSGNHSYQVVYSKKNPIKPLGVQSKKKPLKKVEVAPVYDKKAENRNYQQQNITTYEKKKLPRFLLPFPFGLYTRDPIRPFPAGSILTILPALIVPFIPFGVWEIRTPVGWSVNYLIERFNGYDDGQLTQGRSSSQSRSFANQQLDLYGWAEGFLSNTFGMDGKACVQRLICELAEVPVKDRSMMGEILHRIME